MRRRLPASRNDSVGWSRGALPLSEAPLSVLLGGGDCGPGIAARATAELLPTVRLTDFVRFEMRTTGGTVQLVEASRARQQIEARFGDEMCTPDPVFIPHDTPVEHRIALLNAAGAYIGTTAWRTLQGNPDRWSESSLNHLRRDRSNTGVPSPT